jgi:Phage tail tube protein, GTA-gp10
MTDFNPARGDVKIKLLESDMVLRPTFQAIAVLEDHFNRGIIDIARDFHNNKITHARDFVAILHAGMRGADEPIPDDFPDRVVVMGLTQLIEPCGLFLAHACGIRG